MAILPPFALTPENPDPPDRGLSVNLTPLSGSALLSAGANTTVAITR